MGMSVRRAWRHGAIRIAAGGFACLLVLAAVGLWAVPSPLPDAAAWPVSPAFLDKNGDLFHARLSDNEEYCLPVSLSQMGKWLPLAAVATEDKRFYAHFGIDVLALGRAVGQNLRSWSVVSGASTITSQIIRMTYPRPRSLRSKLLEFAQALKLERRLSKEALLELYLNRAPFGGPVRGVEAASRSYFGKKAAELSLAESALLVGMLRGPSLYRPDKNPGKTLERRNAVLRRLRERNLASETDIAYALLEKLPKGRSAIPQQYRQYADFAMRSLPAGYWRQGAKPVATPLDPYLQERLESRLDEALLPFPEQVTAAGGLVENATGALLAYTGNARFSPGARGHWVDCGNSPRSPGSILKPFLYLLGMEQGWLLPDTLLADTPLSFAGMAPRNYDRAYRGPVTAGAALAASLNAPAVRVLRKTGGEPFIQRLRELGFSRLNRPAAHYGDSLTLGGCEVTLLQTLQAFSTLATLGLHRPITPLSSAAGAGRLGERRLFDASAGYLIAESLRDTGRMSPIQREAFLEQGRTVAFKTGTSYGLRDAWTAVYTPRHTLVVWLGDPEGLPNPMLSGLPVAAPVALRLMRDIPRSKGEAPWYSPPSGLERFAACPLSGSPATPFCPSQKMAWRLRDVSRKTPCSLHALHDGALQVTWPPELENYAGAADARIAAKETIEITMPRPGMRFFITPYAETQQIPFNCEGARGMVYWFVDQEFFGAWKKGESPLWPLRPGQHILSLVDETGGTAHVRFSVIDALAKQPESIPLDDESFSKN
ncbi:MAG: penicillin-binding protein 1C [Deltaproteobacteria bacterium]|jgi:penicillin-binding protein 1C|nr:penicillin-binding protein 1C [Deltaproteobacteria bacterium]